MAAVVGLSFSAVHHASIASIMLSVPSSVIFERGGATPIRGREGAMGVKGKVLRSKPSAQLEDRGVC